MKEKINNKTHIEGYVYDHKLTQRVSGSTSKNPGTEFIRGDLKIATDDAITNIVTVSFTYVTATTKAGKPNETFGILSKIIDGTYGTYLNVGDSATKVRIDSSLGLNDFVNTQGEMVNAMRNDSGFIHIAPQLAEAEKDRATFDVDMLIISAIRQEADPEKGIAEKVVLTGAVFNNFNKKIYTPIKFSVLNARAMDYFEGLGASNNTPVFTHVKGVQQTATVISTYTVDGGAFGESEVKTRKNERKEWVVTWAQTEPYEFNTPATITAEELKSALAQRELDLEEVKRNHEAYASQNAIPAPAAGGQTFKF